RGTLKYVPVALSLAIHGSKYPRKANHTSPPTTNITFLAGGEKKNQKTRKSKGKLNTWLSILVLCTFF
ncbi:MAG: hypothetical protein OQL19_13160, partial [Gammaproteobacteria bacterium]|nr:hypothetical protein [Gammaproteobacteria bacterium]